MNIREYLRKKGITCEDAADQLGLNPRYLRVIWNGTKAPGPKLAYRIQEWSGGELEADKLVPTNRKRPCCQACGRILPQPKPKAPNGANLTDSDKAEIAKSMLAQLFNTLDIKDTKSYS